MATTTTVNTSFWGMYVHQAKDGVPTIVDAAGKPIASPPTVKVGADGSFAIVDSSGSAVLDHAKVPLTLQAYSPPTHNIYAYTEADGTVTIVDASGNPVPIPPNTKEVGDDVVVVDSSDQVVEDASGPIEIPVYSPPISGVYLQEDWFVDAAGNPVDCPPNRLWDADSGGYVFADASGKAMLSSNGAQMPIPTFSPPTTGIYLCQGVVVDSTGNAVPWNWTEMDTSSIPPYSPPTGVFFYTGPNGTPSVVDAAGKPIFSPHPIDKYGGVVGSDGKAVVDPTTGDQIRLPAYSPPTTGVFMYTAPNGTPSVVDAAGNPILSPPPWKYEGTGPVIIDYDGDAVLDRDGNPISIPVYDPTASPRLQVYIAPDGSAQVVDAIGKPVANPPTVALHPVSGRPAIVDANGQFVVDANGNLTTLPTYSPPTEGVFAHVVTDPVSGAVDVQIVDAAGNLVQSPPGYKLVSSADPSDPPTVVFTGVNGQPLVDAGGGEISPPLYLPPTQGIYAHVVTNPSTGEVDVQLVDAAGNPVQSPPGYKLVGSGDPSAPPTVVLIGADGQPLADTDGNQISPPTFSPPTQGIYAHLVTNPSTGAVDVQIVDGVGNLVQSPPGYKLVSSGDPSAPPTVVFVDSSGQPITDANGNQLSPPTYSPLTQGIYAHVVTNPSTGEVDVQLVDAAGNLVPSPPGYTVQKGADPSDPPKVVLTGIDGKPLTDQDGNPISVPLDSSSATPPGALPSADEVPEDDTADTTSDVSAEGETASEEEGARGERGVEEEIEPIPAEELVSAGEETPAETAAGEEAVVEVPDFVAASATAVPEVEGKVAPVPEPDAVEFKVETTPTEVEAVAFGVEAIAGDGEEPEERSAEVESDTVRISTPDEVSATPITPPDIPEEVGPVDPLAEIGVIGVGTEEFVEMVSGPAAEEGEVAAAEVEGSSPGGEQVVEIPDLLSPELDRKGDDRPVPGSGDVEFGVEVAPTEELAEVEPITEVVGVDSVTGLGSDELGGVLAGRDAGVAAEEAGEGLVERVEAEGSGLGEEVPELKWGTEVGVGAEGSIAGEAVVPELEGKIVPDVEPEVVEFQVEVVPVVEAETLEIVEEAAGEPMRILEEPNDEPVGRYLIEEEPDEADEIRP